MSTSPSDNYPEWQAIIKNLLASAWKDAPFKNTEKVDHWLRNFTGDVTNIASEQKHAFHLLTQLVFFGKQELDECLRVLFQENLLYPYVQKNRVQLKSPSGLWDAFSNYQLKHVRFVGLGNPAESGPSFLYRFRKVNSLSTKLFSSQEEIVTRGKLESQILLNPPDLEELVYLDDFCGSGTQAKRRVRKFVEPLKASHPNVKVSYLMLFGTHEGLEELRSSGLFNCVKSVVTFDKDYQTFCDESHYFRNSNGSNDRGIAKEIMQHYGARLVERTEDSLGFGGCELLVSFEHNTPNNTLPVIWATDPDLPWHGIFPRSDKIE